MGGVWCIKFFSGSQKKMQVQKLVEYRCLLQIRRQISMIFFKMNDINPDNDFRLADNIKALILEPHESKTGNRNILRPNVMKHIILRQCYNENDTPIVRKSQMHGVMIQHKGAIEESWNTWSRKVYVALNTKILSSILWQIHDYLSDWLSFLTSKNCFNKSPSIHVEYLRIGRMWS